MDLTIHPESGQLVDRNGATVFGTIPPTVEKILAVLQKELSVQIQADCSMSSGSPELRPSNYPSKRRRKHTDRSRSSLELSIVLYGRPALFESVGEFAAKCNMYLQHPQHCDRNVLYMNPHCLSSSNGVKVLTKDLDSHFSGLVNTKPEILANPIDLFTNNMQQDNLVEAGTPHALRTTLYKHQKQALTFMLDREKGWAIDGRRRDIWKEEKDSQGRTLYLNTITGHKQLRSPAQFRGGLLIDAPGLGKSLSIIALLATDFQGPGLHDEHMAAAAKTLLVVPKSCKSHINGYPWFVLKCSL